jgi:hypothetical protein
MNVSIPVMQKTAILIRAMMPPMPSESFFALRPAPYALSQILMFI